MAANSPLVTFSAIVAPGRLTHKMRSRSARAGRIFKPNPKGITSCGMLRPYDFVRECQETPVTQQTTMKASEVRDNWSQAVDAVAGGDSRIRIERSGIAVAGLVSARDLEWLAQRDRQLEELRAVVRQMREAFADVPTEEIEAEVARALAEVRGQQPATTSDTAS